MLKYELENILIFLFSFSRVFFSVSELIKAKSKYASMWKVNRLRNFMKIKSSQNTEHREERYILKLWFRFPHWLISTVNRVRIDHQSLFVVIQGGHWMRPKPESPSRSQQGVTRKSLRQKVFIKFLQHLAGIVNVCTVHSCDRYLACYT